MLQTRGVIVNRIDRTGREWTCRHYGADMWFSTVVVGEGVDGCGLELQAFRVTGTASVWAARALVTDRHTGASIVVHGEFSFYSWTQAADAISVWWDESGIEVTCDVLITAVDGLNGLCRNLKEGS